MKTRRWPLYSLLAFGYAFLYVPVLLLVVYSFNASRLVTVWGGFSTHWYGELLKNTQILDAAWLSVRIATVNATLATILGSLAAMALVRGGRFRGRGQGEVQFLKAGFRAGSHAETPNGEGRTGCRTVLPAPGGTGKETPSTRSAGPGPFGGGAGELGVLQQDPARCPDRGLHPGGFPPGEFRLVNVQSEFFGIAINGDAVTIVDEPDRPADPGFRRNVSDHKTMRTTAEAAIGDEPDRFPEPLPHQRPGDREHFPHPRPADRTMHACNPENHGARL